MIERSVVTSAHCSQPDDSGRRCRLPLERATGSGGVGSSRLLTVTSASAMYTTTSIDDSLLRATTEYPGNGKSEMRIEDTVEEEIDGEVERLHGVGNVSDHVTVVICVLE